VERTKYCHFKASFIHPEIACVLTPPPSCLGKTAATAKVGDLNGIDKCAAGTPFFHYYSRALKTILPRYPGEHAGLRVSCVPVKSMSAVPLSPVV
jgi:hypothetical protein